MAEKEVRPQRICDLCGQVDNHPRHVIAHAPGTVEPNQPMVAQVVGIKGLSDDDKARIIADVMDTTTELRHMDCCAEAGCPTGTCGEVLATVKGDKALKGDALVKHLTSGAVDHLSKSDAVIGKD